MKNFKSFFYGLIAFLFVLTVSFNSFGKSLPGKYETHYSAGAHIDVLVIASIDAVFNSVFKLSIEPGALPTETKLDQLNRVGVSIPVNDYKYDNTNYQLIRFSHIGKYTVSYRS